MTQLMPLARAFENIGLGQVSRCLTLTASQSSFSAKPQRHVREAEYYLRCHLRGESGPLLEAAIARLVICALQVKSTPEVTVCLKSPRAN